MRIGFYSPYLDTFGGGERYMLTLASHFSKNHKVDIFWDDSNIKAPLSRFLKIDLSSARFKKNIFNLPPKRRAIATLKYKVIFVLSDGSIPFSLAQKNILHFQVPFTYADLSYKTRLKLRRYKWIIANSYFTKGYVDKTFNVNSKVIYPPVDVNSIQPGKKEKIILSVGRFGPNQLHPKKQDVLIEVFKEIYKQAKDWKLVLVGQAKKEDEKYLRSLRKMSRGFAIKIIENQPIEALRKLYSRASIYWHATGFGEDEQKFPEKMEHFGISTVEASAAGAVPIVIGRGGQKEIIESGVNGILWNTKAKLYEETMNIIKNPKTMAKLSMAAIKNSKRFSEEKFFEEYEKIIL